ncbi:MAG TPA: hypothetical protein VKY19_01635 [Ktedonosporobacter sp.]|jgi:hypothetical protein|nr:hypothetical protein [Ktedonosporobacter sp.]
MVPETLQRQLTAYGVSDFGETALREALERHAETYTLIKLAPWPARRWKCRYRLLMGNAIYDAQSVAEAYAVGLLATLKSDQPKSPIGEGAQQNNF